MQTTAKYDEKYLKENKIHKNQETAPNWAKQLFFTQWGNMKWRDRTRGFHEIHVAGE